MTDGSHDSLMGGPSSLHESIVDRGPRKAGPLRPLSDTERLSAKGDRSVHASISEVYFARRPPAVLRRVGTVVVDPVQFHSRRGTMPNVIDEVLKGSPPPTADRDPATAVIPEPGILWIVAPLDSRLPRRPLRRHGHAVGHARLQAILGTETSATLRPARSKVLAERLDDVPAGASADPSRSLVASGVDVGVAGQGEDFEPTELMARKIHALAA